ncbi:very low-density lipoprotein receptor-like isoform X2 [Mytilus trossulus]|uniref:very low-density lipoprotein receptor-like isoform X2 n=1 Tax=Mytilus trossulus TaxID=6551 RepID=UPI00300709DF
MWKQFNFMLMVLIGLHLAKADDCLENELECRRSEQCYPKEYRCDGYADCSDGTDECGCEDYVCPGNRLKCPDDVCGMEDGKLCDGRHDCPGSKDEEDCEACVDGAFHCSIEKKCIPSEWHCDGVDDCDGEDEKDCTDCNNYENGAFLCTADSTCIRWDWVCDSYPDCSDGEEDIGCPDDGCENNEFKCNDPYPSFPKCVPGDKINDGTNDCGDCSDEKFAESCVPGVPGGPSPPVINPPAPQHPSRGLQKARGQMMKKDEGTKHTVAREQRRKKDEGTVHTITREQRRKKDEGTVHTINREQRRKKDEGRVHTVARSNKDIDAHRKFLTRGKSNLKDNLINYLLHRKTDDRLANRILSRREKDKRKPKAKKPT